MKRWSVAAIVVSALFALAPSAGHAWCDTDEYWMCGDRCEAEYQACVESCDPNDADCLYYCEREGSYCSQGCDAMCW